MAMGLFVAGHLALSSAGLRRALVRRTGEWPFLGLYSLLSLALFTWVLRAYGAAPDVELWVAPAAFRFFALGVMAPAFVLVVAGYTQSNPTAVILDRFAAIDGAATGITRITRHPVMWGAGLWAVAHALAAGNGRALILFGGLGVVTVHFLRLSPSMVRVVQPSASRSDNLGSNCWPSSSRSA